MCRQEGTAGAWRRPRRLAACAEAEHFARLKAEAESQDYANRLRVAQEQLAEYAAQKAADALLIQGQAEGLHALLGGGADAQALSQHLDVLRERIAEAANEAKAFAAQQKADVETLKRSSVQVLLGLCAAGLGMPSFRAPPRLGSR